MAVDMHMPTTLTKNLSMVIKAPFNTNPQILRTLESAHRRLQAVLTQLRPGHLVLSFDSNIMHRRLVEKITKENGVPSHVVIPRTLGEKMCVPFGKMLRGSVVPNTVTKTVHTERVFPYGYERILRRGIPRLFAVAHTDPYNQVLSTAVQCWSTIFCTKAIG